MRNNLVKIKEIYYFILPQLLLFANLAIKMSGKQLHISSLKFGKLIEMMSRLPVVFLSYFSFYTCKCSYCHWQIWTWNTCKYAISKINRAWCFKLGQLIEGGE